MRFSGGFVWESNFVTVQNDIEENWKFVAVAVLNCSFYTGG